MQDSVRMGDRVTIKLLKLDGIVYEKLKNILLSCDKNIIKGCYLGRIHVYHSIALDKYFENNDKVDEQFQTKVELKRLVKNEIVSDFCTVIKISVDFDSSYFSSRAQYKIQYDAVSKSPNDVMLCQHGDCYNGVVTRELTIPFCKSRHHGICSRHFENALNSEKFSQRMTLIEQKLKYCHSLVARVVYSMMFNTFRDDISDHFLTCKICQRLSLYQSIFDQYTFGELNDMISNALPNQFDQINQQYCQTITSRSNSNISNFDRTYDEVVKKKEDHNPFHTVGSSNHLNIKPPIRPPGDDIILATTCNETSYKNISVHVRCPQYYEETVVVKLMIPNLLPELKYQQIVNHLCRECGINSYKVDRERDEIRIHRVNAMGWSQEVVWKEWDGRSTTTAPSSSSSSYEDYPEWLRNPWFHPIGLNQLIEGDLLELRFTIHGYIGGKFYIESIALSDSYNGSIQEKLTELKKDYEGYRKIRGDGNCYYRAVIYGLFEQVLCTSHDNDRQRKLNYILMKLSEVKYKSFNDEYNHNKMLKYIELASEYRKWQCVEEFERDLLDPLTELDTTLILASKVLVTNLLITMQNETINELTVRDAILLNYPDVKSVEEFCEYYVMKMGVCAEGLHVHLGFLPSIIFRCACRIMIVPREDRYRISHVETFPPPLPIVTTTTITTATTTPIATEASQIEAIPKSLGEIHLLLRPGHYDLLYPQQQQATTSDFVVADSNSPNEKMEEVASIVVASNSPQSTANLKIEDVGGNSELQKISRTDRVATDPPSSPVKDQLFQGEKMDEMTCNEVSDPPSVFSFTVEDQQQLEEYLCSKPIRFRDEYEQNIKIVREMGFPMKDILKVMSLYPSTIDEIIRLCIRLASPDSMTDRTISQSNLSNLRSRDLKLPRASTPNYQLYQYRSNRSYGFLDTSSNNSNIFTNHSNNATKKPKSYTPWKD